jgi:hypothetical protein
VNSGGILYSYMKIPEGSLLKWFFLERRGRGKKEHD